MTWRTGTRLAVIGITVLAIAIAIAFGTLRANYHGCVPHGSRTCQVATPSP